jgi:hypothetical protein
MGFYGNEHIIINFIISCEQPPLILHKSDTFQVKSPNSCELPPLNQREQSCKMLK